MTVKRVDFDGYRLQIAVGTQSLALSGIVTTAVVVVFGFVTGGENI